MTTRITIAAGDIRIGDFIYNGLGTSKHPTDAWEAITQVNTVDGLIQLITGRLDTPHGEFWFEPDEPVVVVRHPPPEPEPVIAKPHRKHGHGH
ncbi:MAG: hypothetical protein H6R10_1672 [Rhodocyclaceae bacterium]|nr:hypothetical protein [Rhodocyclaceae bacterium]